MADSMAVKAARVSRWIVVLILIFAFVGMISGCSSSSTSHSVSGTVTSGGSPLSGVTVTLAGAGTTTTDAGGYYSFGDVSDGTYTVTMSLAGYTFLPPNRTVYILGNDAPGFDFYAIPSGYPNKVISAGATHTLFLLSDGTVKACGNNTYGQLGDGTVTESHTPVQVVKASSEGGGTLSDIRAVAAGNNFSLALDKDGNVWAWGLNDKGQLGDGSTTNRTSGSVKISGFTTVTAISAGYQHAVAMKSDGTVWTWGSNSNGQLGDNTNTDNPSPAQVLLLTGVYMAVSAGYDHTVVLKNDGTVWTWGGNFYGQLGLGTSGAGTDVKVPIQLNVYGVAAVSAGTQFTMALIFTPVYWTGTVVTWGHNNVGQLGNGITDSTSISAIPINIGLTGVSMVSAGGAHAVALKGDGTVWTWGDNTYGQLGDGSTTQRSSPVQALVVSQAVNISAGTSDSFAVQKGLTNGWAWGLNANGQLGDGTITTQSTPTTITLP